MRIVLFGMARAGEAILRALLPPSHELVVCEGPQDAERHASGADVLVGGPITAAIGQAARRLRLFHAARAGLDGAGLEHLAPHVPVARSHHHEVSIAEYVVMGMLWIAKRPAEFDARMREGDWEGSCIWGEPPVIPVLEGSRALLIGTGHIARETARRLRAFGARTVAVSRNPVGSAEFDEVIGYGDWRGRLPEIDWLIPCCPLTPETRGLIGAEELAALPRSAGLINVARGELVDEEALYEALRVRRIAGAALDVWYRYPSQAGKPSFPSRFAFHELANVLMTPHVSGWTRQTIEGRMRDVAEEIRRVEAGLPLLHPAR